MQITINKRAAKELVKAITFFFDGCEDITASNEENAYVADADKMKVLDTNMDSLYELAKVAGKIKKKLNQHS